MRTQHLFRKYDSFAVVQSRIAGTKRAVNEIDAKRLTIEDESGIAEELVERFDLQLPVLGEPYIAIHEEKNIDVSHDPMRIVFDRSRPCYVRGTRTVIRVPFTGAPELFGVQPSTFNLNPPYGAVVGNEIEMEYERADNDGAAIKIEYQRNLQNVNQHLAWLRESVGRLREELKRTVIMTINDRKKHLSSSSDMLSALNLPIRLK